MGQFLALSLVLSYPIIITFLFILFNKKRLIDKKRFSVDSIVFGYILFVIFNFSLYFLPSIFSHPVLPLAAFITVTGPQIVLSTILLKKYSTDRTIDPTNEEKKNNITSKVLRFFSVILLLPILIIFSGIILDGIASLIKEKSYIGTEKIVLDLAEEEKILNIKKGGTIVETKNDSTTYTDTYYVLSTSFLYRIETKNFSIIKKIDLKAISNDITNFYVYSYFPSHVSEDIEHVYLTDNENKRMVKIDEYNHVFYLNGKSLFHNLMDIDVDGQEEDHIRILDGNRVVVLNRYGKVLFEHDGSKTANGMRFNAPTQIWGYNYIYDKGNHKIREVRAYTRTNYGTTEFVESEEEYRCKQILPKYTGMINDAIYLTLADMENKQLIIVSNANLCTSSYITNVELLRVPFIGVKLRDKDKILVVYNDERNALYLARMDYDLLRKIKHKIERMIPEFNFHA